MIYGKLLVNRCMKIEVSVEVKQLSRVYLPGVPHFIQQNKAVYDVAFLRLQSGFQSSNRTEFVSNA